MYVFVKKKKKNQKLDQDKPSLIYKDVNKCILNKICHIYYLFMYDFITLIYLIHIFLLFCRYAVPDFPFAVDSKIQCENLNKIINELLKGLFINTII